MGSHGPELTPPANLDIGNDAHTGTMLASTLLANLSALGPRASVSSPTRARVTQGAGGHLELGDTWGAAPSTHGELSLPQVPGTQWLASQKSAHAFHSRAKFSELG